MTLVRHIKAPLSIPAILPHGPLQQLPPQPDAVTETLNDLGHDLTQQTAITLLHRMGIDNDKQAKHTGWNDGPRFVRRDAASPKATDKARTTPVSRAWRRATTWLRELDASRSAAAASAARWNLLCYRHDMRVDDHRLQAGASAFQAWKKLLTPSSLADPT